jgi:hypothetical protein
MTEHAQLPDPPEFSEEEMEKCRETGDYMPVLFEWYKFVGQVCIFFAQLDRESPAVKAMSPVQYGVLVGLLNRCARLMLANLALSHNGRFGEATALLDRCIFESSLKVQWLCLKGTDDSFERYLADGLKTEIELKLEIEGNINGRESGEELNIEKRMLASISRHVSASKLTEDEILSKKKLPDIASMINDLGHGRLMYVVAQRLGSHHVHGTWPSLLLHYLEVDEDDGLYLRDHNCASHPNQFVMTPLQVLEAVRAFIEHVTHSDEEAEPIIGLLDSIQDEILKINSEMVGSDFDSPSEI